MIRSPVFSNRAPHVAVAKGVEWTQCDVANRHRREIAHAMLAIEVGDLPEPFDEADVVCESLTSARSSDNECRRVHASQFFGLRSQREFRVTTEESIQ